MQEACVCSRMCLGGVAYCDVLCVHLPHQFNSIRASMRPFHSSLETPCHPEFMQGMGGDEGCTGAETFVGAERRPGCYADENWGQAYTFISIHFLPHLVQHICTFRIILFDSLCTVTVPVDWPMEPPSPDRSQRNRPKSAPPRMIWLRQLRLECARHTE